MYHIHTVIFPLSRIFALGEFPLLADCESPGWTPVYTYVSAIIFQRKDAQTISGESSVDCHTQKLLPSEEVPLKSSRERAERYEQLANASAIYAQLGRLSEAGEAAERAEAIYSNDMTLHFIKAQIATNAGQPEEADLGASQGPRDKADRRRMVQPRLALYQRAPLSGGGGSAAALRPSLSSSL